MTRDEARDQIVIFMCDEQKVINDRDKQALDMAIQALEQEPITKITRKYCVQDESGYTDEELVGKVNEIIDYINKEPRQDLQQAAERIIEQQNKWFEEQERKEQEPAYCDRNICLKNEYNGIGCEECEVTKSQEPKTGHWEEVGEEYIQVYDLNGIPSCGDERICSECGFETVFIGEHCSQYKFCPNCGCRMVEPQEGE